MEDNHDFTPEEIERAAARDAIHAGHEGEFTLGELRRLVEVPTDVKGNPQYQPLRRLRRIWETEIERLPDGPVKNEIMDFYDKRAQELFASEIVNLPDPNESDNPRYQPAALLEAIGEGVRDFPFAREESRTAMLELIKKKKTELGIG